MFIPSLEEYCQQSKDYNLVPVYTELLVDMETPISIFKKVCREGRCYLLESVEGGENLARYSFIGFQPLLEYICKDGRGEIRDGTGVRAAEGPPLDVLEEIMSGFKAPKMEQLPRFYGGAVGYFGYDLVRYVEDLPRFTDDDLQLPDGHFIVTRVVLIFDHVKHKVKIVVNTCPGEHPAAAYNEAGKLIRLVAKAIQEPNGEAGTGFSPKKSEAQFTSNISKQDFLAKVLAAKEYIKAGDIFQVVLSQRLQTPLPGEPFDIYRHLRALNPAPYLYYLNFAETLIIGSSPEMLIRVEDGLVQTCPIAGTRPRGRNREEDRLLEAELLADEKEKAEHLMLVDLGRNDLGRVCEYGTIEVKDFMAVEKYSHVMHIVSTVEGKLAPGKTGFAALKACFPAGTLSGAPKIRAMEIIEELEPTRRGIYGGVIGYFGFTGNLDSCITIRTILVHKGITYVQVGAGIVADSDPEREYDETVNKAGALMETLLLEEVG